MKLTTCILVHVASLGVWNTYYHVGDRMFSNFNLLYLPECLMMKNIPHDREKTITFKIHKQINASKLQPQIHQFHPTCTCSIQNLFWCCDSQDIFHDKFWVIDVINCHTNYQNLCFSWKHHVKSHHNSRQKNTSLGLLHWCLAFPECLKTCQTAVSHDSVSRSS